MADMDDWVNAFNINIKTKSFEKFNVMMFDPTTASKTQKAALAKILFDDHKSVQFWGDYIDCVCSVFPDRKLQLQRLVSKALEILDSKEMLDNRTYTTINLQAAALKT
jgi:hypothetical protein